MVLANCASLSNGHGTKEHFGYVEIDHLRDFNLVLLKGDVSISIIVIFYSVFLRDC